MKYLPNQWNNLEKYYKALQIIEGFKESDSVLSDENFGEKLTLEGIHQPRNKSLSPEEYIEKQKEKDKSSWGHYAAGKGARGFFEHLGLITLSGDKKVSLSPAAKELLEAGSEPERKLIWKNCFLQLQLSGTDGEASHPYRILLELVHEFPGIEKKKLLLALEAENDSDEEILRIKKLAKYSINKIKNELSITDYQADNAVKILPKIAAQLGDVNILKQKVYPTTQIFITEDEIVTEEHSELAQKRSRSNYRAVDASEIAADPNLNDFKSVNIDLADAINIRQKRLSEHQEIVRLLGKLNQEKGLDLFEGKFDCLGTTNNKALLYEVKTILDNSSDQEKQTVKGFGQLKFYKYSIVQKEMGYADIQEFIVFSQEPAEEIKDFCLNENISVIWRVDDNFLCINEEGGEEKEFNPGNFTKKRE